MKKSTIYILPRPMVRKRRPWRILLFTACVIVAACIFFLHENGIKLVYMTSAYLMPGRAVQITPAPNDAHAVPVYFDENNPIAINSENTETPPPLQSDNDEEHLLLQVVEAQPTEMPAPPEIAARSAVSQEEPEQPGMFLASLGEGLSIFQNLPFFVPAPFEERNELVIPDAFETMVPVPAAPFDVEGMFGTNAEDTSAEPVVYSENERYTVETDPDGREIFRSSVAKGDTAGVILNEWLPAAEVVALINAVDPVYPLKNIVVGKPFVITREKGNGEFISFRYEIGMMESLLVERQDGQFTAAKETIQYDTQLVIVEGIITSNLFEAVSEAGEGPSLAITIADVFSCEVNFINEIRQGDKFNILVEKLYRDGEFKAYGNMLAGTFTNRGSNYEAFMFPDASGRLRHYNSNGEALQKALLKAPLAFTRVSSGYSMNRRHPVFGYSRPHQGVDYAAPTGTPIKAVGDGLVTKAGWGSGYGNMVVVKHSGGLQSQYAHMSRFARNIKSGVFVKQGQIIGYVGATGVATGPHLDFRLIQNGKFIDPTKAIVPRLDPIGKSHMAQFQETVKRAEDYLKGDLSLAEYTPIVWQ